MYQMNVPVDEWRCQKVRGVEFLTRLRMSEEWRSVLVPIFKSKGDELQKLQRDKLDEPSHEGMGMRC